MSAKFNEIRNQLPHGAQKIIASRAGVSRFTVNQVLSGKSDNLKVLQAIAEYLKEYRVKKNEAMSAIESVLTA